jgi:predicted GNAT family acetyltransferase
MAIAVRPAQDNDIPRMAKIRAQERRDRKFWTDRISLYMRGEHNPQHALAERVVFVAVDNQEVVGFAAGHRTRRLDCDGELQWIDVAIDKRRQGIAETLIAQLGLWFVEHNANRVCVNVATENVAARQLYAKCGAHPLKEGWMVWDNAQFIGNEKSRTS